MGKCTHQELHREIKGSEEFGLDEQHFFVTLVPLLNLEYISFRICPSVLRAALVPLCHIKPLGRPIALLSLYSTKLKCY